MRRALLLWLLLTSAVPAAAPDPAVAPLIESLGLVESATPVRERQGWRSPRRIVVRRIRPDTAAWFGQVAPGVTFDVVDTDAQALAAIAGADAVIGFCEPPLIEAGTSLEWVQSFNDGAVGGCVIQLKAQQHDGEEKNSSPGDSLTFPHG
jgi:hypothetical protein